MRSTHIYYNRKRFAKSLATFLCLMLAMLFALTSCGEAAAGGNESAAETSGKTEGATGTNDPSVTDDPAGTTSDGAITEESNTNLGAGTEDDPVGSGTAGETDGTETSGTPAQTTGGSVATETPGTSTDPVPTQTEYQVTVLDNNGKPMKSMIVHFYQSTVEAGIQVTNSSGVAKKKLETGEYTFIVTATSGNKKYFYDESKCFLSPTQTSVTISLTELASGSGETITAWGADATEQKSYYAYYVKKGSTLVSLTAGDMTYVIFAPTESGYYRFSTDPGVDIGYYGGTFNVQSNKAIDMIGDYFEINIRASSVSADGNGANFVLGLIAKGSDAKTATVKIERVGDAKKDSSDEPYLEVKASEKYLKKYTGSTSGKLKDFDVTDATSKIVYNAKDGYYHFGTETGPVVMLRIKSKSPYLDSFTDICDKSVISHYYYKENGDFDYKVQYNSFIASYAAVADASGVVPLNDELIDMLKTVTPRWCDETSPEYRFNTDMSDKPIAEVKEISWLFACCYYE